MEKSIKYKTKNDMREIRVNAKKNDTSIIIFDFDKWIGTGIKLEKDVAINLASNILNFYNMDFVFSDKISTSLKNIEDNLNDTYNTMKEQNYQLWDDDVLELKMYIEREINKIRG